jgi:serine/threonine-protein kinase
LVFTPKDVRRLRFFSGLQDVLTKAEQRLFGTLEEEVIGTHSDKQRLAIYYVVDWILRQTSEFSLTDAMNASKRLSRKIALAEEVAPRVIEDIIRTLIDAHYLEEIRPELDRVFIGAGNVGTEKKYRVIQRRIVEMGGTADIEEDEHLFMSTATNLGGIQHLKFIKMIGSGGMGTVYQAVDERTGQIVAVKILSGRYHADEDVVARFEREARVMEYLRHPNIVQILKWGKENGRVYIVMEFVDGLTLDDLLRSRSKLDLKWIVPITSAVANAGQYIHDKGFVRYDIKPSNIMLTEKGRVCLLDFGIIQTVDRSTEFESLEATTSGAAVGTPLYMAPEQFEARKADARSDIYSLGVVVYKMLTGVCPFEGNSFADLMNAHLKEDPKRPSYFGDLPSAVDEVILKALSKDPERRQQSMQEFSTALEEAAGQLPSVDLQSLVTEARKVVEQIKEREQEATLYRPVQRLVDSAVVSAPATPYAPVAPDRNSPASSNLSSGDTDVSLTGNQAPPSSAAPAAPNVTGLPPNVAPFGSDVQFVIVMDGATQLPLSGRKTVGRSIGNDFVIDNPSLSRFHCAFVVEGSQCSIDDFNSANGTYVNGVRVVGRKTLEDGDGIRIGQVKLTFHVLKETSN